jgi:hypothetical protein
MGHPAPAKRRRLIAYGSRLSYMVDKRKTIVLRISPGLADALHRWARDELRSVNAQIEYVLRDAVRRREGRRIDEPPADDDNSGLPDEGETGDGSS